MKRLGQFVGTTSLYAAAAVLMLGAVAKFFMPGAGLAVGPHHIFSPFVVLAVATVECLLGWWLLRGWLPGTARFTAIVVFTVFGLLQVYNVLSENTSCGCFGTFTVPPAWMVAFDTLIVAGLTLGRPPRRRASRPARAEFACVPLALAICIWLGVSQWGAAYQMLQLHVGPTHGIIIGRGMGVHWDMISPKLPLRKLWVFQRMDPPGVLDEGRWVVFFSRSNCPRCSEVRQSFVNLPPLLPAWNFAIVDVAGPGLPGTFAEGMAGIVPFRLPGFDSEGPVAWSLRIPAILVIEDDRLKGVYYDKNTLKKDLLRSSP